MRTLYTLTFVLCLLTPNALEGQVFKIYDNFSELEERIAQTPRSTLLVINFWATYCKPCVKELPLFNQLHSKYAGPNFEVLLVSLDFKSQLEKKFVPFLRSHPLSPEVILLSDQNADNWIPRVSPEWEGLIPVTALILGEERVLHEGDFEHLEELEQFIRDFLHRTGQTALMHSGG